MKVLNVTSWYPSSQNPNSATWIKNHIESLPSHVEHFTCHFEVSFGKRFSFHKFKYKSLNQVLITIPFKSWFFIEILNLQYLFYLLVIKKQHKGYDIINFHIAYPLLTYWHWIKKFVNKPIIITEHWSAYHYNFNVKKELPRIKKIFQQKIPVITVSKALSNDIKNFSNSEFLNFILPNIVDESIFHPLKNKKKNDLYFMVSQWKSPKTPLFVMKAFLESSTKINTKLIIGGFGPLWEEMQEFVSVNNVESQIRLVGKLNSKEIAFYMQRCKAFLHPTDYETFSVVCAEAVACGALVIAPNKGGIPEVIKDNGILINDNTFEHWVQALERIPEAFESSYENYYSRPIVGKKYSKILQSVINGFK